MSRTRMRLGALVTAGALTLGLVACGGDDEPGTTPAATVDGAGDATDDATEDGTTQEDAGTGDASGESVPVEEFLAMLQEPGEETLSSYTTSMDMDLEGQQTTMEGAVDLSGDSPRMQITMTVPDMGEMDMVFADGQIYMSMPGLTPEGMYLLAPEELIGDTAALEEIDISAQWDLWEAGAQEVVFVGEEDVDGQQLRRYQMTVDSEAVMDAAGVTSGPDDAAATSLGLDEETVYDIWLDGDNLMRMMAFEVTGQAFEMHIDDWGEPQDIEVPDPDQVMDMGELGTGSG